MSKVVNSSFSPSVNITRDSEKDFHYVTTKNAEEIYEQIVSSFSTGIHSFSMIGSYGSGKSSFLVALKRTLKGEGTHFRELNGKFSHVKGFEFDLVVGRHESLIKDIAVHFELAENATDKQILAEIEKRHNDYKEKGIFWFIILDEFGKYLEYASKHNPEGELYLVQQLAEFANEEGKHLFFINTLHQAFDSYAFGLDQQQRKEWDKVKGRLKELAFNEPVEQLLFIASEHLKKLHGSHVPTKADELLAIISAAQVFPLRTSIDQSLAHSLYPLDLISASTLALALQAYGQNERSLFSFLHSDDSRAINRFDASSGKFYGVSKVYDYLIYSHHSFLTSKYNPHYVQWNAIKNAINRVEVEFDQDVDDFVEIIKVIGLLNIFAASGAKLNIEFLSKYVANVSNIEDAASKLETLDNKKIIRYRAFKNQYILFEGTDYDIELELKNAKVDEVTDVVSYVREHFSFPYIPAKQSFYKKGIPRFFEFQITDSPISSAPIQPVDGIINIVFDEDENKVIKVSKQSGLPIFYGVYNQVDSIRNEINEIKKIEYLIKHIESDQVAYDELIALKSDHIVRLDRLILSSMYSSSNEVTWIYKGEKIPISGQRSFNNRLSTIIEDIYFEAPVYKNELINKYKVSPSVYKPRKDLLRLLMEKRHEPLLGFSEDLFPPEKTMYLSLLYHTGLHREENGIWDFYEPNEESDLYVLWKNCEAFIESTKSGKKPLTDLINQLQKPPVGLKDGFLELWVPLYVMMKSKDCALYHQESYMPDIDYDVINLVFRNPKLFEIKAFDIDDRKRELFNKYRTYQQLPSDAEFSNESFVETIKPFLLTYNDLNEYGRKTSKISAEARRLRDTLKTATDPERAFFESIPEALGYSSLDDLKSKEAITDFITTLQIKIEEIEQSFNQLIIRIEGRIKHILELNEELTFEQYLPLIKKKFSSIKQYKLADYQKKLLSRILSQLPDKEKWISAVGLAAIDKPINKLRDDEEEKLFYNLSERLHELESLVEISKEQVDEKNEEAFQFELIPFGRKPVRDSFKISKKLMVEDEAKVKHIRKQLTGNKKKDLTILFKLIEEISNK